MHLKFLLYVLDQILLTDFNLPNFIQIYYCSYFWKCEPHISSQFQKLKLITVIFKTNFLSQFSVDMCELTYMERIWCLIRFFVTPKQKAHFTGGDSECRRLWWSQGANHWHFFWGCPVASHFWLEIHKILERMFNTKIPFQFSTFILGKVVFHPGHFNKYLFGVLTVACK